MAELDIRAILAELDNEGVEFLIIGGVAVGYTATSVPRPTLTLFLDPILKI